MSTLSSFISCEAIQMGIAEAFAGQTNIKPYSDLNITKFLLSSTNTSNVLKQTIAPVGKLRTVRVIYGQRPVKGESSEGALLRCERGEKSGETSKDYTLDPETGFRKPLLISPDDLKLRCEADSLYIAREVMKLADAVMVDAEQYYADQIALNMGNFATDVDEGLAPGTTTRRTVYAQSATGVILTDAYEAITGDAYDNQTGSPVLFGARPWWNYFKKIDAACCSEIGIDAGIYAAQNGVLFAPSRESSEALGAINAAFALAPGAVQLIYANEFANPTIQMDQDSLKQGTILYHNAQVPITLDYKAKYDDCENLWDISVALNSDLAFMPDDMYKVGDRLSGVNGITSYELETCYTPCTP